MTVARWDGSSFLRSQDQRNRAQGVRAKRRISSQNTQRRLMHLLLGVVAGGALFYKFPEALFAFGQVVGVGALDAAVSSFPPVLSIKVSKLNSTST